MPNEKFREKVQASLLQQASLSHLPEFFVWHAKIRIPDFKMLPTPSKNPKTKNKVIFKISIKFCISRCENLKNDIFGKA